MKVGGIEYRKRDGMAWEKRYGGGEWMWVVAVEQPLLTAIDAKDGTIERLRARLSCCEAVE